MSPLGKLFVIDVVLLATAVSLSPKASRQAAPSQAVAASEEVPFHFELPEAENTDCPQVPSIFQPILDAVAALPNVTNTEVARTIGIENVLLARNTNGETSEVPAVLAPHGEVRRDHPVFDYQASDGESATVLARFQGRVDLAGAYSFAPPNEREVRGNLVLVCWNLWDQSPLLCVLYAGLSGISVSEGQEVAFGDPLGETGYGLHFESRNTAIVHVALYGTRRGPLGPTLDEIKARATQLPR